MAKLSRVAGDPEKAARGVWCEYYHGMAFLVARIGSPAYQTTIQRLLRPHRRKLRLALDENDQTAERAVMRAVSKHVVLDWRNIEDDNGEPIPYSADKCYEILADARYRDLFDWIMEVAADAATFREADIEETAGNSASSSTGASATATPET